MSVSTILNARRTISVIVCSLSLAAMAATPVAVWDGDFTATQTGYTLNLNGNTLGDGNSSVTIDQAVGVTVTSDSTFASGFTVLVEYSGLDTSLHAKQVLATSTLTDAANRTGATIDTAGKSCGIWAGASWNSSGTYNSMTSSQSSGILVFSHYSTTSFSGTGTQLYYIAPDTLAGTTILNAGTLGSDTDKTKYKGFSIGGSSAAIDGFSAATGMKISKIAVFSGVPGLKSIQAYCAGTKNLQVSADKTFSEILDDAGITSTLAPYTSLEITAVNTPTITFDVAGAELYALTVNGSAVFDMDSSLYENGSFSKKLLTVGDSISAPDATYNVNADWKGAFVQSSDSITLYAQNAETISINIGGGRDNTTTVQPSPNDNLVSGSDYVGLYPTPGTAWNNISGHWSGSAQTVTLTSAKAFDGETTTVRNTVQLSGTANNTWAVDTAYTSFLRGYLDDTGAVEVKIVGVPYSKYDVIIYATSDNSQNQLNYFTINGANYTCGSDGIATEGTSAWGAGQTKTAQLGKNAMLVQGVTGSTLTISGTRAAPSSGPRVTVCAVQIVNKGVVESSDWSANLNETTTFAGGTGTGLSEQSGTWVNGSLASITLTNNAETATLTLDGEIVAGTLKIVGAAGKKLFIDKAQDATLDIAIYDLTESVEEATFLFNPDFSKVNAGANLVGVGYDYTGTIGSGFHYIGSANTLTLGTVDGSGVNIGGGGTITNNLDVLGNATVTLSGAYTTSGFSRLGATKGTIVVDSGSDVTFSSVMLANSGSGENYNRLDVNGTLWVSSVSTTNNVYSKRNDYEGILFGHWKGTSTVNVGAGGSILAENAWMQLSYSTNSVVTINGGAVKVAGINGGPWTTDFAPELTLTGGGCLEFAESPINMDGVVRNYGYGTIKTYSHGGSTGWTDPGAITFTDATNGITIDPCGMTNIFSGTLTGAGKIIVSDSVGGGCVSFTGNADNLTGDIVVGANTTLNLGTSRPTGVITVADGGTLAVQMQNATDIVDLAASARPASVVLYDANGNEVSNPRVNYSDGTLTIAPVPTLCASGMVSFDTADNWVASAMPSSGEGVFVRLSGDATITVSESYALGSLTILGSGTVTFSGDGVITPERVDVLADATYICNGQVVSCEVPHAIYGTLKTVGDAALTSTGNAIDAAGVLDVESGTLTLTSGDRTLKGTIYVRSGATLAPQTTDAFNYSGTQQMHIYGTLSMGTTRWTTGGNNTIYLYGGASVTGGGNSQGNIDMNASGAGHVVVNRNETTGDSVVNFSAALRSMNNANGTIAIDPDVTLVMSGKLINQQKITKSGSGSLVFDTPEGSSGGYIWVADGAIGGRGYVHNITMDNGTKLQPTAGGLSVNGFYVMSAITSIETNTVGDVETVTTNSEQRVTLSFCRIDPASVSAGDVLTLLSVNGDATLSAGMFAVSEARYTTTVGGKTVMATVKTGIPQPFMHYDFNNGAAVNTGAADDSSATPTRFVGEAADETLVSSRNGKAVKVFYVSDSNCYTPYWDTLANGTSPFHAGEVTVTTVAKLGETGIILWGLGAAGDNMAMGLAVLDTNTVAVVARVGTDTVEALVTATSTDDLTAGWHFFAVVANANGTTLYVDNTVVSSGKVPSVNIGQQGQLGSFHGGAIGASKVGANGYLLDDWRVYDAALTAKEIKALKRELNPDPLFIRLR